MKKQLASVFVPVLLLAGCATSSTSGDRSLIADHATTVAGCGVGNYLFYYLKTPCGTTAPAVAEAPKAAPMMAAKTPVEVSSVAKFVGNKIEISEDVTFKTGSSKLTPHGNKVLDEVAKVIEANNTAIAKVEVEGHTDQTGNPAKNMTLSEARADTVKSYLEKKGIDSSKLVAKGYGQTKPKFDPATSTKAQISENRRVEFSVETARN